MLFFFFFFSCLGLGTPQPLGLAHIRDRARYDGNEAVTVDPVDDDAWLFQAPGGGTPNVLDVFSRVPFLRAIAARDTVDFRNQLSASPSVVYRTVRQPSPTWHPEGGLSLFFPLGDDVRVGAFQPPAPVMSVSFLSVPLLMGSLVAFPRFTSVWVPSTWLTTSAFTRAID